MIWPKHVSPKRNWWEIRHARKVGGVIQLHLRIREAWLVAETPRPGAKFCPQDFINPISTLKSTDFSLKSFPWKFSNQIIER